MAAGRHSELGKSELVNKKASMSVENAIRLSKNFASSPET
jgi:plasmid maintenance system antidote protein VapI